jgi:hypothetical protein
MATYYAGIGGNDANAGTSWALRKLTIQAAVNVATNAGDSVIVGPGTYRETVTMGTSGSAGNVISLIGDYTGANTSGTKGVVRITGSNNDISATRAYCINTGAKNYVTVTGFALDLVSSQHIVGTGTDVTVRRCYFGSGAGQSIYVSGASQARWSIESCVFAFSGNSVGVWFAHYSNIDSAAHSVTNCIIVQAGVGVRTDLVGGIAVKNCVVGGGSGGIQYLGAAVPATPVTVNNCILFNMIAAWGIIAQVAGQITENYNTLFNVANTRFNVTTGANSVTRPPLFDTRWFFEALNGGTLITPFDLAGYSTLVEYNSGTGAPSTDTRGASVVGTYREWGALEFNSALSIAGGGASRVIGSPFIRGLGAV